VQWSGTQPPAPPEPGPDAWRTLNYLYDAAGRRIAKQYDGVTVLTYIYDGDHCIAEYDAYGNVKRKYIYGPGVDEPISMIEAAGSYAGTYYYHFDALGSVVGLTNASGNTVEVYEYDVYGRVGATDASHPNRFMFTGREYDKETGLYYYRARYYNPQIGRFLQTDPVGYEDGMNWYRYCGNNPVTATNPSGRIVLWPPLVPALDPAGIVEAWRRSHRPACPGNWSWDDYWRWYFFANGEGVNLDETGLGNYVRNSQQISDATFTFRTLCIADANRKARELYLEAQNTKSPEVKTVTWSESGTSSYSFSASQLSPPLGVLGGGQLHMSAQITADSKGRWTVNFTYRIDDPFKGALTGLLPKHYWWEKRLGERDWPGSHPYNMWLEWHDQASGDASG
jgi:RHS repeat-associated protein